MGGKGANRPERSNESEQDELHVEIEGDDWDCVNRAVAQLEPLLHPEARRAWVRVVLRVRSRSSRRREVARRVVRI